MKQKINKIAVIGGSGKAGKYLIKQLLHEGYSIKVLIRNPERFPFQYASIEMITGDATHCESINALLKGADAVISTLGLGLPPGEPTIFSLTTKHIIEAMNACGIKRYVVLTGLNVDTPEDKKGVKARLATDWMYRNFPKSTADRQLEYDMLAKSNIDWTLIRLPLIDQTDIRHEIAISLEDCPGDKISSTSLSHFLIQQLVDKTYIKKAPFISNT
jgi:putative NADH-flavin reductase